MPGPRKAKLLLESVAILGIVHVMLVFRREKFKSNGDMETSTETVEESQQGFVWESQNP